MNWRRILMGVASSVLLVSAGADLAWHEWWSAFQCVLWALVAGLSSTGEACSCCGGDEPDGDDGDDAEAPEDVPFEKPAQEARQEWRA